MESFFTISNKLVEAKSNKSKEKLLKKIKDYIETLPQLVSQPYKDAISEILNNPSEEYEKGVELISLYFRNVKDPNNKRSEGEVSDVEDLANDLVHIAKYPKQEPVYDENASLNQGITATEERDSSLRDRFNQFVREQRELNEKKDAEYHISIPKRFGDDFKKSFSRNLRGKGVKNFHTEGNKFVFRNRRDRDAASEVFNKLLSKIRAAGNKPQSSKRLEEARKKKAHRKLKGKPKGEKGSTEQYKLFRACEAGWDGEPCKSMSSKKWKKMRKKWEDEGIFKLKKRKKKEK